MPSYWEDFDVTWRATAAVPTKIHNPEFAEQLAQYIQRHPNRCPQLFDGGRQGRARGDAYFQKVFELVVLGPAEGPAEGWQKVPDGHVGQGAFGLETSPDSAAPRLRQESGQAAT